MKKYYTLLVLLVIIASCNNDGFEVTVQKQMSKAEFLMESSPDSSYCILNGIRTEADRLPESMRMEYLLLLANAQNRADRPFMDVDSFKPVVRYYNTQHNSEQYVLSLYLLGRMYHVMKDDPKAMECFQKGVLYADSMRWKPSDLLMTRIHAQVADVYLSKLMYAKALNELDEARKAAVAIGDTVMAQVSEELKVKPLMLLGRYKDVIELSEKFKRYYMSIGDTAMAAICHEDALYAYIQTKDIAKANAAMVDYEKNSGLFDAEGRICRGYEMYYFKKGSLLLLEHKYSFAASEFRKLMSDKDNLNNMVSAYRGLLMVYSATNEKDSIGKYAKLYCEANDSLIKQQTELQVASIESAYDYSRNRIIAEQKHEENEYLRLAIIVIIASFVVLGVCLVYWIREKQRAQRKENEMLVAEYNTAKRNLELLHKDSKLLAENYKRDIVRLENKLRVAEYGEDEGNSTSTQEAKNIIEKIHREAKIVANHTPMVTESDWKVIEEYVEYSCKDFYGRLLKCRLNDLDIRIVMLYALDFEENEIKQLTGCFGNAFTNRKSRINEKVFGKKSAMTLKTEIKHCLESYA